MKNYLLYGFLIALGNFLLSLILFLSGLHSDAAHLPAAQVIGGLGSMAIGVTLLVLGIRAARAEVPPEQAFGYGRAFGAGFAIQAFASVFSAVTTYIYSAFINPHLGEIILQSQAEKAQARGMTSEQIERMQGFSRMFLGPTGQALSALVGTLVIGGIIALIVAAFLKRSGERDPLAL
jgi:Protein of unknown function (DUF4199)